MNGSQTHGPEIVPADEDEVLHREVAVTGKSAGKLDVERTPSQPEKVCTFHPIHEFEQRLVQTG